MKPTTELDTSTGTARIPLFRRDGTHAWVVLDLAGLAQVEHYRWWEARTKGRTSYAAASWKGATLLMHRLLTDAPPGCHVDHVDGDGLNNRRGNIRLATPAQNRANEVNPRHSTSPYKGVMWAEKGDGWHAHIGVDRTHIFLGSYDDPISAALAYDDAARELYGEFARTNFTAADAAILPRTPRRVRGARFADMHGVSRYRRRGCRCPVCKSAWAESMDRENARRRLAYRCRAA